MITGPQTHQCGPTGRKLTHTQSPSVDFVHIPYLIQGSWVALLRDSSSQELKTSGGTGSGNEEGEADGQRGETREGEEERRFYKRWGASKIDGRRSDTEVSAEHKPGRRRGYIYILTKSPDNSGNVYDHTPDIYTVSEQHTRPTSTCKHNPTQGTLRRRGKSAHKDCTHM